MNGATEATLQDLLAVAQAMNANLVGLNRLVSRMQPGGGGGGTTTPLNNLAAAAGPASVALKALSVAGDIVSNIFGKIGDIVGKVIGGFVNLGENIFNFAKMAMNGTAKLSDFYSTIFKGIPIIENFANVFADIIRFSEGLLESYRNVTQVGAVFGGNLYELSATAARAYMTVGEFTRVINQNSEIFATMGGRVQSGIEVFADANAALMGPESRFRRSILGMGFTAEQAADMLADTMKAQGILSNNQNSDAKRLAESTYNYMTELDTLSKITGQRKDQIDAEVRKAKEEAFLQRFLDSLQPSEREKFQIGLATMKAMVGEGGVEQFTAIIRGLDVPVGDLSNKLAIASGGVSLQGQAIRDALFNANISAKEFGNQIRGVGFDISNQALTFVDSIGTMAQAAGVGREFVTAEMLKSARVFRDAGSMAAAVAKANKDQSDQASKSASALALATQNIRNFGAQLMGYFSMLIQPFADPLMKLSVSITETITAFVGSKGFKDTVQAVTNWLTNTFTRLGKAYEDSGFEGLFKELGKSLLQGASNIWNWIKPAFETMWTKVEPELSKFWDTTLKPMFLNLLDNMWNAFKEWAFGPSAETLARQGQERRETRVAERQDQAFFTQLAAAQLAGQANVTNAQIDALARQLREQYEREGAADRRREEARAARAPGAMPVPTRHSGTLGMTGNWWEKENAVVEVQAGETVATQSQIAQIVDAASQKGVAESILALNNTMRTLIAVSQRIEENTKETVRATKHLNGDVFKMV